MRRDVFQAIADPTRREILNMLAVKSHHLNSVAENFEMSRPAISKHIKILEECGLIVVRQEGRMRYCEVKTEKLDEVQQWIEEHKKLWTSRFDALDDYLQKLQSKNKRQPKIKKLSNKKSNPVSRQR